ncbi:MAG: GFA family protein [Hyphomicrobiaceae bacterium]
MSSTHTLRGECHCGAIQAALTTSKPADALQVRACQCGFCTRHGAMTVSDPNGRATFVVREGQLQAYQFATRTGTSLICQTCGVYVGVMLKDGDDVWSVMNVRGLAVTELLGRVAEPVSYDNETAEQRITRRKAKWTPTEIRLSR